jgi:hypothetical protein
MKFINSLFFRHFRLHWIYDSRLQFLVCPTLRLSCGRSGRSDRRAVSFSLLLDRRNKKRPDQPAFFTRACAIRARARSASFTVFESGNKPATSGSSNMIFLPSKNRFAYFPRTPLLKSYSALISGSCSFFLGLFINFSLSSCRQACADNSDCIRLLRMCNHQKSPSVRCTKKDESILINRMIWIESCQG